MHVCNIYSTNTHLHHIFKEKHYKIFYMYIKKLWKKKRLNVLNQELWHH